MTEKPRFEPKLKMALKDKTLYEDHAFREIATDELKRCYEIIAEAERMAEHTKNVLIECKTFENRFIKFTHGLSIFADKQISEIDRFLERLSK